MSDREDTPPDDRILRSARRPIAHVSLGLEGDRILFRQLRERQQQQRIARAAEASRAFASEAAATAAMATSAMVTCAQRTSQASSSGIVRSTVTQIVSQSTGVMASQAVVLSPEDVAIQQEALQEAQLQQALRQIKAEKENMIRRRARIVHPNSVQVAVTTQPVQPQGTQPQQLAQQPVSPGPQPGVVQGPGQPQWVPKTAIAALKPFTGDKRGEDLDTWLRAVSVYFRCKLTLPHEEVIVAASYLEGSAARWLSVLVQLQGYGHDFHAWAVTQKLEDFLKMVEDRWHDPHEAQRATDAILTLHTRQFKSVREATDAVERLICVPRVRYDPQVLLTSYLRCFSLPLRNQLAREANINMHNFPSFSKMALDLEAKIGHGQTLTTDGRKKTLPPNWKAKGRLMFVDNDGSTIEVDEHFQEGVGTKAGSVETSEGGVVAVVAQKGKATGRRCGGFRSRSQVDPNAPPWEKAGLTRVERPILTTGLKLDDAKVANIRDWPCPQSVTEMRSFFGMTGYYRTFIKNYSIVAAPLTDLTRLDTPWEWTDECEATFRHLKHVLTHYEVLKLPDPDKPFIVTMDANQYGIGAVLAQQEGPKLRPVKYMSKKMSSQKLASLPMRRNSMRTDHQTLRWMRTQPVLSDALKRWIEVIEQYDFDPQYMKGEYNKVADALSRRPDFSGALITEFDLTDHVTQSLVEAYREDQFMSEIIRRLKAKDKKTSAEFELVNGLLFLEKAGNKRLCVPNSESLRSLFLGECHDATGHFGYKKTATNLLQWLWRPTMMRDAQLYVETCQICQRDKPRTQALLGLLKPLRIPERPGESLSMDFMDTLITSKSGMRHIFVIVDKFSKYARLIAMPETAKTEYVIRMFKENWVRDFGLPKSIISDRDVQFTSELWKAAAAEQGTQLQMTSGNHPEANGQAEQLTRAVQHLLRHYIKPNQVDWDEKFALIASLYNNAVHSATGVSPNSLLLTFKPRLPLDFLLNENQSTAAPGTLEFAYRYEQKMQQAEEQMQKAQAAMIESENRHRRPSTFQVGDRVWVKSSELGQEYGISRKLMPQYFGRWEVLDIVGIDPDGPSYVIRILGHLRTYPIFHASKLAPFKETDQFPSRRSMLPPTMDGEVDIDDVVDHRELPVSRPAGRGHPPKPKLQYRVWFRHHTDPKEDRWFTREELMQTAPQVATQYERSLQKGNRPMVED
ncbi:hypothetical protein CBR_g48255 [Chara braunii]|uniref:Integrase catalytic domain-containing protein n=1 Tax=Chara braunii TaxID=69332 RepID=A0A388M2J0_CHABU|nr:hypothetical protein CBR_g48255 [Chara braunii]|eukprot:GBG88725.1 hypothetical protein CBR_g48255 [Chara braunii]